MASTPTRLYRQALEHTGWRQDSAQASAMNHLQALHDQLTAPEKNRLPAFLQRFVQRFFPRFFRHGQAAGSAKGIYLWGGVGRGKTWLMDLFYQSLPEQGKTRLHFQHFMQHIHRQLRMHDGAVDPLAKIARHMAQQTPVICLDEFFVTDITDAMILARLLEGLFDHGATLVTTTNVPPDDLYREGLQRSRFLPAIDLLKQHTHVIHVDGATDYRLTAQEQTRRYYSPLNEKARQQLRRTFDQLVSHSQAVTDAPLMLINRPIPCLGSAPGVAGWFSFAALCAGPRSPADYIELASLFPTLLLEGLPQLDESRDDQARRFISLVDELYDRHRLLILSAQVPIDQLYTGNRLRFEFQRTASRLHEMQSPAYEIR